MPKRTQLLVLSMLLVSAPSSSAVDFRPGSIYSSRPNPTAVVGDFNGDGKPDIASADSGSGNVSILLGTGDGVFVVADFNEDQTPDLAVAVADGIASLTGNREGTFRQGASVAAKPGPSPRTVTADDSSKDSNGNLPVSALKFVAGGVPASQLRIPGKALKEYQRSLKAYNSGDLNSSTAHLQKALVIYPQFLAAHNSLGLRYDQLGDYQKALSEHAAALAISPTDSDAHINLSLDLMLLNRYSEAEGEARQAIQLAPKASAPRYVLGRALIGQLQLTSEAIRMLKESQDTFPKASLVLSQLHFALGNTDETLKDLRQYLRAPADRDNKHKAECWLARLVGEAPDASCSDVPERPSFQ